MLVWLTLNSINFGSNKVEFINVRCLRTKLATFESVASNIAGSWVFMALFLAISTSTAHTSSFDHLTAPSIYLINSAWVVWMLISSSSWLTALQVSVWSDTLLEGLYLVHFTPVSKIFPFSSSDFYIILKIFPFSFNIIYIIFIDSEIPLSQMFIFHCSWLWHVYPWAFLHLSNINGPNFFILMANHVAC